MTLKIKLIRNGEYVVLFFNRTIFFGHEGRLKLQEHIGDFEKHSLLKSGISTGLLHKEIIDSFNFLLHSGFISLWELPGFIFKIEKDKDMYFERAPGAVLETMDFKPPINSIKFDFICDEETVESVTQIKNRHVC